MLEVPVQGTSMCELCNFFPELYNYEIETEVYFCIMEDCLSDL